MQMIKPIALADHELDAVSGGDFEVEFKPLKKSNQLSDGGSSGGGSGNFGGLLGGFGGSFGVGGNTTIGVRVEAGVMTGVTGGGISFSTRTR